MAARGMRANELNRAMGKEMGFVSNLKKRKSPTGETLELVAKALRVRMAWLISGEGEMFEEGEAPGSPMPPAVSTPRVKMPGGNGDHWFPDHIEDLFNEALQELGGTRYTGLQIRAAKVFVRDATNKLVRGGSKRMVLGALEAAQELDEAGEEPVPPAIFALLVEKNAPASEAERQRRAEGQAFADQMQRKAAERVRRSQRPRKS